MGFCDYLIHGTDGVQSTHFKNQYSDDQYTVVNQKGSFNGHTVVNATDDETKTTTIDGVIQVKSVADKVRNDEQGFWNRQKSNCKTLFTVTFIKGMAGLIGAIVVGAVFPPLFPVAIAVGAVSLGVLGFSFFSLYRSVQAKGQEKDWNDPVSKIVDQRKQAESRGFNYVYNKELKGRAVTTQEVQEMWHTKMQSIKDAFINGVGGIEQVSAAKIRQFFDEGHLSKEKLDYTFADSIPEELQTLSELYTTLSNDFATLGQLVNDRKDQIHRTKRKKLLENDRQRDAQLRPWLSWLDQQRQAVTVVESRQIPGGRRGRGQFVHTVSKRPTIYQINRMYEQITAPIHALHARNARQYENWAKKELAKIGNEEQMQLQNFLNPVIGLLQNYSQPSLQPSAPEVQILYPQLQTLYPQLDSTKTNEPSAPPLEDTYTQTEFHPEWETVMDENAYNQKF